MRGLALESDNFDKVLAINPMPNSNIVAIVFQRSQRENNLNLLFRFVADESGATAIEYGLIAALISVVIIGAVTSVGTKLSSTFVTISGKLA